MRPPLHGRGRAVALFVHVIYMRIRCEGLNLLRPCPYNRGHRKPFLPNLKQNTGPACLHFGA